MSSAVRGWPKSSDLVHVWPVQSRILTVARSLIRTVRGKRIRWCRYISDKFRLPSSCVDHLWSRQAMPEVVGTCLGHESAGLLWQLSTYQLDWKIESVFPCARWTVCCLITLARNDPSSPMQSNVCIQYDPGIQNLLDFMLNHRGLFYLVQMWFFASYLISNQCHRHL